MRHANQGSVDPRTKPPIPPGPFSVQRTPSDRQHPVALLYIVLLAQIFG